MQIAHMWVAYVEAIHVTSCPVILMSLIRNVSTEVPLLVCFQLLLILEESLSDGIISAGHS